jgi:serine/threonine protein kinase
MGSMDAVPRDCADKFEVDRLLGLGGFGAVYLARHRRLDRPVALKVPHLEAPEDPEQRDRSLSGQEWPPACGDDAGARSIK